MFSCLCQLFYSVVLFFLQNVTYLQYTYLPTYLPAYLPPCRPTYLHTHTHTPTHTHSHTHTLTHTHISDLRFYVWILEKMFHSKLCAHQMAMLGLKHKGKCIHQVKLGLLSWWKWKKQQVSNDFIMPKNFWAISFCETIPSLLVN